MELINQFGQMIQSNQTLLIGLTLWEALWTLIALWFSARNNHKIWFLLCGIINLFGLIELIYLFSKTNFFKSFRFDE